MHRARGRASCAGTRGDGGHVSERLPVDERPTVPAAQSEAERSFEAEIERIAGVGGTWSAKMRAVKASDFGEEES